MVTAQRPPPTVLLTGFDAFGGERLNPSWLAVQALHGHQVTGHRVIAARLPTVFDESLHVLRGLLKQYRPALVICVGQAGGRSALSLERVAINVNDARIADNAAAQPVDTPVIADGPAAYFTTLPIKAMLAALRQAGVAVEVSQTAGTFVCNHVFYGLMHLLATQRGCKRTRGGFIHVPYLPEQGAPAMTLDDMVHGLRLALRCALTTQRDIVQGAGAVS
ncbi:pyroglutamyl-peptidase I [Rhodoferax sediminis]|uniref:Pyrrolidone-carboxylate peptidase n=1 Tax=Rhodoferax sediminis TaxID=2509614 RepID=A0A515DEI0_9BURK|nr:pyroglutamyl-peptidase I [Rhodoferax sediminis]QDL38799.1 pyroglutamyl-peptidase I [Rhodoferax sediminis]